MAANDGRKEQVIALTSLLFLYIFSPPIKCFNGQIFKCKGICYIETPIPRSTRFLGENVPREKVPVGRCSNAAKLQ